jgi:hypothetical protein
VSLVAWVVSLIIAFPLLAVVLYFLLDDSFVRLGSGELGLLVIRGRATDRALLPGSHFVPSFRRMSVQAYPSLELSYRATDAAGSETLDDDLERVGAPLQVTLGDRAVIALSYTLRFQLVPDSLRSIHERFGPDGIWAAVRDVSGRAIRVAINDPSIGIDDLFGPRRIALDAALGTAVSEALATDGFVVTLFSIGETNLGFAGEVIQATVRSRHSIEREDAEAPLRVARARHDAELQPFVTGDPSSVALRYRETEAWREVAQVLAARGVMLPAASRSPGSSPGQPAQPTQSASEGDSESAAEGS